RLVASGVLLRTRHEGATLYALADPGLTRQELATYRTSFEDPEVDRFLDRQAASPSPQAEDAVVS
ncbi:MAG TPA: hypothetical protein VNX21_04060, partial [Candidatus Thermoplasmatota archaeon]|nr:hypothetical protein [Candidatus Thermoplasmatota archaeon]